MGVVHEGTWPTRNELIDKSLARLDCWLIQSCNTIHPIGQALPMPMNAGVLWQFVRHKYPNSVTLDNFNRRARALPVVTPQMCFEARCHLTDNWFCDQMELLDALIHTPRQCPTVQRYDGVVGSTTIWNKWCHRVRTTLNHGFRQCRHGHATDSTRSNSSTGDARVLKKISSRSHFFPLFNDRRHRRSAR